MSNLLDRRRYLLQTAQSQTPDPFYQPLTFTAVANCTFILQVPYPDPYQAKFKINNGAWDTNPTYDSNWVYYGGIQLSAGDTVSIIMDQDTAPTTGGAGNKLNFLDGDGNTPTTHVIDVSGNIMSLYRWDNFTTDYNFTSNEACHSWFYGADGIGSAKNLVLPSEVISSYCYHSLFYNCATLYEAPQILPALSVGSDGYGFMFYNCKELLRSPDIQARTMSARSLNQMFYNCSKLSYIKAMFTQTPSGTYSRNWVYGVASSGTFVKNRAANWNATGTSAVPSGWTIEYADT